MQDHIPVELTLVFLLASYCLKTHAQERPSPAPGFPTLIDSIGPTGPQEGAMLADLDRDGRLDIIVASSKTVYAFRSEGSLLPGWPQKTTFNTIHSPAVGDLNGDGTLEIITLDREGLSRQSFVYAWACNGIPLPGFPVRLEMGVGAISLFDLDNDGDLEIMGGFGQKFYVFHHDGSILPGWPKQLAPFYPMSKASVGDLNRDGFAEIVIAAEFIAPQKNQSLGRLYAWDCNGNIPAGWPIDTPSGYLYASRCDPALVDVDRDGFLEIAVGSYVDDLRLPPGYAILYRHDGTIMPGWPIYTAGTDSLYEFGAGPAVANLDDDEEPELIFADLYDHIVAWNGDGSLVPNWPVLLGQLDSILVGRSTFINPSAGDIDGDGNVEILTNNNQAELIDGIWLGRIYAFNHDASSLPWSPLRPRQTAAINTVAMGDLEGDGTLELITLSGDTRDREVWLTVWQIPGVPYVKERFPWPMYGHDRWHTSQYGFELPDEPSVRVDDRNPTGALPTEFALEQNYPNPFMLSAKAAGAFTEIRFALPRAAQVQIRLFDILGAEVKSWAMMKPAGVHQFRWNGRDNRGQPLPRGVYFYRLEAASAAGSVVLTKKLLLMRQR
ncbi:FG-GAP-like repeat-containing protein [bacterium]|nr:FG-GAP-like repeat-containing protein [bacterium]